MSLAETYRSSKTRALGRPAPPTVFALLTLAMTLGLVLAFALNVTAWTIGAMIALPLVSLTAIWISGGAATAVLGAMQPKSNPPALPEAWAPSERTAILFTLCGEDPGLIARHLSLLHPELAHAGLGDSTEIFVLSDTSGDDAIQAEQAAFRQLRQDANVTYRRRRLNTGRKPGNIAEWLEAQGDRFAYMMVLDADSRMTARRIRQMIWQMERRPAIGLLQAGIGITPGTTRFGRHQRISARLLSRGFGRGFAWWTGPCGNYWGHNAIMRVAAFRAAVPLPHLSGAAPFGGDPLSHDFIEAAWIRRAGWAVVLDPDPSGSTEAAPQTLAEFHRRDRRWCQGNLQHLRLLSAPGISPISRLHLASGILSYLVSPVWLLLVALIATGAVAVEGVLPVTLVATVLLLPKLCALADWLYRARTGWRRAVVLRAWIAELFVSSVIAPLVMLRQSVAVASVCLGRDCGWKSGKAQRVTLPDGKAEAGIGLSFVALMALAGGAGMAWLAPVILPLCAAPILTRALAAHT